MMSFKVNRREFDRTLTRYTQFSKRAIPVIVNTKAFYIARGAILETPSATKLQIGKQLSQLIYEFKTSKKTGKTRKLLKQTTVYDRFGNKQQAPLAALMVNARRGRAGQSGLYGAAMTKAIHSMLRNRLKGIAFLKSGWLWAVKALEPLAEKRKSERVDPSVKKFGKAKGAAYPAPSQGVNVTARILNMVTAKWDTRDGAAKYAVPALQRAFDAERQSMIDFIEKKLKEGCRETGIRHH